MLMNYMLWRLPIRARQYRDDIKFDNDPLPQVSLEVSNSLTEDIFGLSTLAEDLEAMQKRLFQRRVIGWVPQIFANEKNGASVLCTLRPGG